MTPSVTVIVAAYESQATVADTLEALRAQTVRDFETIVVDSSPTTATVELVRERFPEVRMVHSPRRLLPHAARNRGVEHATGEVLAFTDADCMPERGWVEALAAAHAGGHALAGGALACLDRAPSALAVHVGKFVQWLPGTAAGPCRDLPSANLSISRELFDRVGPFPEDRWSGDTLLCWRAAASGEPPMFVPGAVVGHRHDTTVAGFVGERFRRGRDFGLARPPALGWSRAQLALRIALAPLAALVLTARVVGRAPPGRMRTVALLTLPIQLAGAAAWALGEARGYVALLSRPAARAGAEPRSPDAACGSRSARSPG